MGNEALAQCGDSIDLATWVEEGDPNNGVWTVGGGGFSVNQTINGDPTFYVSPDSFVNVIITGDIIVNTTADDDWIGFVFGYVDPDSNSPTNYDFYLFDWKQNDQNFGGWFGPEGFSLSRVNGPITNLPQAFSAKAGPYVDLLASDYGNNKGWNDLQLYKFALTYTNTRTVISVDGDTIFDIYGCFPPGRFGFYNYSLSQVNYSNFSYRVAAAFDVLTPNVCLGDTARFVALSDSCENAAGIPVNNTLVAWDWDFGDGQTSTDTNASHYYDSSGTYLVTLVVTDYLGCKDTAYSSVDIHENTVSIGPDTSICQLDSIPITAPASSSYAWSNGDTTQTAFLSAAGPNSVTVTSALGCTASDTMIITHLPLPTVDLGPDTSICNDDTVWLYAGNPGLQKLWSTGDTTDSIFVSTPNAYYCQVTDSLTCSFTDTMVISNFAEPIVSPPNPELCFGDTITITATGAETYQWYPNFSISSDTGVFINIFTPVDTTYFVIGIDSNGCTDTSSFFVDVHARPVVALTGGDSICFGDSMQIIQTLQGQGPWDYSYTIAGDTIDFFGLTNTIDSFYVSDSGWFTPISIMDSECPNDGPFDSTFVQVEPLPVMSIVATNDSVCFGSEIVLTAASADNYLWSPNAGLSAVDTAEVVASPDTSTTYKVVGTSNFGCSDSTDQYIEVLPLPIIGFTVTDDTLCLNDSTTLTVTGGNTYLWSNSLNANSLTTASITVAPDSTADFHAYVTDVLGCTDSVDTIIHVDTLPVVSILPEDTAFCLNDSALITAFGASTYGWSPAVGLSAAIGSSVFAGPANDTLYTVVGTDLNGCIGHDSIPITIYSLPPVSVLPDSMEICIGDVDTLISNGANTYEWSPNYSISSIVGDIVSIQPSVDTTYSVVGTDSNGCQNQDSAFIKVHPLPIVELQTDSDSVCLGIPLTLSATGAVQYQWTPQTWLNASNQQNVVALPTQNVVYNVFGTDINGCINSDDTAITVVDLPNISVIPPNAAICDGESQLLRIAATNNDYVWSPLANLALDGNNNDTVTANPDDTTIYTINATNFYACESDTTYTLAVTPLPVLTISASKQITCTQEENNVSVTGANSYSWFPVQNILNPFSANPIMSPPVTRKYYVTGTGDGGCQTTDSITLDVYEIPNFSAGEDEEYCIGDSVQFQAVGGVSYQWGPTSGLSDPTIANPYCSTRSTQFYQVTITDANGCAFRDDKFVVVNPLPAADAGSNKTICEGEEIRIGGDPTGPVGANYEWTPRSAVNSFVAPNPAAYPLDTTTIQVRVVDTNGCENTDEVIVRVVKRPTLEVLEKPKYLCLGDTGRVSLTPGIDQYEWTPSSAVADTTSFTSLVYPQSSDPIRVVATGTFDCQTVLEFSIDVKPLPTVSAKVNVAACEGDTVVASGNSSADIVEWSPRAMFLSPDSLVSLATPPSRTEFTLRAEDEFGCVNYAKTIANVYALPEADAGEDIQNCNINTVYLGGDFTTDPDNFVTWTPAENLSDRHGLNPYVLSPENVTYYLEVESPLGCFNYDTITVFSDCYDVVYIPSTFTPNDDGVNDVFLVSAHRIQNGRMVIRNKWGHVVFESNNVEHGWDGTKLNEGYASPDGVYYYLFLYQTESGRHLQKEGTLTLIR
ncbi:MAG: hypothetical protein Salg2KO_01960 [Salibacteraceae bacterium]